MRGLAVPVAGPVMGLVCLLAAGCAQAAESQPESAPSTSTAPSPSRAPSEAPSPEPSSSSPATDPPRDDKPGTVVITADSEYGPMLYDATGQPIYLFTAEPDDRPECYGACAEAWPPVLTTGSPRARGAVKGSLLGVTRRTDGTRQVTYGGHPLYFYAHEGKYQVLCHDVEEFGGTWLVVRPDGTPAPG